MKINVTQDCIDGGIKGDSKYCPIAIACLNQDLQAVRVELSGISFLEPVSGVIYTKKLPDQAKQFIKDYDDELQVEPFSFEIEL